MRTKVLLIAAALAASLASSMAQNVYSLNVVGYYNIPLAANEKLMIANQLNTTNNTLAALIPSGPPNANFFKYAGSFVGYQFDEFDLVWKPSQPTIDVGQAFFYVKAPTSVSSTWVRNFTVQ